MKWWIPLVTPIITGIILFIIAKSWEPLADFIGYPYDHKRRLKDHLNGVSRVTDTKNDLLRLDPFPILSQRIGWLKRVDELIADSKKIEEQAANCGWNYIRRCRSGREASKVLKRAEDLVTEGKEHLQEARLRPHPVPASNGSHLQDPPLGMESYRKAVTDFIRDNEGSSRIGIWGMSGVGKTHLLLLVREYMTKYAGEKKFIVIYIEVGRDCTPQKLLDAISLNLGIPTVPNISSQQSIIYNFLLHKNFVVLLDDIWEPIDVTTLGFPSECLESAAQKVRHKFVFTTRQEAMCGWMRAGDKIHMTCLNNRDAGTLFARQVGHDIMSDKRFSDYTKMIVKECGGLPDALCKMGKAMSVRSEHCQWECAVKDLKRLKLHKVTCGKVDFFSRMKLSYDVVEQQQQFCFLSCSLWPEEENIPREKLIRWWTGLGFLDDDPWQRGSAIIKDLLQSSLLDVGDNNMYSSESTHVKVHTMNRKMALWIVKQSGSKWIPASFCKLNLPMEDWSDVERAWASPLDASKWLPDDSSKVCCPQLSMLVCCGNFKSQPIPQFENIKFLDLEGTVQVTFPQVICSLSTLEHFDISATSITMLPPELAQLLRLKYLYVRHNSSLRIIDEGLILNLNKLQKFDMFCSGTNFFELSCCISVLNDLAGKRGFVLGFTAKSEEQIRMLVQLKNVSTQALCLDHFKNAQGSDGIDLKLLGCMDSVRELCIVNSNVPELIIQAEDGYECLLPCLEYFELINLRNLTKVVSANMWCHMRVARICCCRKLKDATWVTNCENLHELSIAYCQAMVKIIDKNQDEHQPRVAPISFCSLKKIYLEKLPRLCTISDEELDLKDLSYICVVECSKLKLPAWPLNEHKLVSIDCELDWWRSVLPTEAAVKESCLSPNFMSSRNGRAIQGQIHAA